MDISIWTVESEEAEKYWIETNKVRDAIYQNNELFRISFMWHSVHLFFLIHFSSITCWVFLLAGFFKMALSLTCLASGTNYLSRTEWFLLAQRHNGERSAVLTTAIHLVCCTARFIVLQFSSTATEWWDKNRASWNRWNNKIKRCFFTSWLI